MLRTTTIASTLLLAPLATSAQEWQLHAVPALHKVRPDRPLPPDAGDAIALEIARGECELGQPVISATSTVTISGARVDALTLPSSGGARISPVLYRQAFLDVKTPSNTEGATGRWPDALIPLVDTLVHERRNALPVTVPARTHQPLLLEVCAPPEAAPGRHLGTVVVEAAGQRRTLPLSVLVHDLLLPPTGGFPATFGLSGRNVLLGHDGRVGSDARRLELVDRYARLALKYRLSLHVLSRIPPAWTTSAMGSLDVDTSAWERELTPVMDGDRDGRFALVDLRIPDALPRRDWGRYAALVRSRFAQRGWADRLFAYVMDEPRENQRAELESRLTALAGSGVARLVTMPIDRSLVGQVEIWAPNLNCLDHKERRGEFCKGEQPREAYREAERRGARLFWYQSCSSHGCGHGPFGDARDRYFSGWPSYMVDADPAAARIMGWQAFVHEVAGELYFDAVYAFGRWNADKAERIDPWEDLFAFGGNGDGTLFYPGRPDRIGGQTDIPIASLRLAHIRDGLEELELLRLLAGRGAIKAEQARRLAQRLAPRLFDFGRSPADFAQARAQLLAALAAP